MFKTTFSKYFSTYVAMILLALTITGVMLSAFVLTYVTNKNKESLVDISSQISELTSTYIENSKDKDLYFQLVVDGISSRNDCFITIVNRAGDTVCSTSNSYKGRLNESITNDVFKGETSIFTRDTLGVFSEEMLSVATPIESNGLIIGAVFASMSHDETNSLFNYVVRICLMSDLLTILVALLLSYFVSKRMIKPIKKLNSAAKRISKGDFEVVVDNSNSALEIAEFTQTFNEMSKSLSRLENMRSSFIANVSHELRTPLTTISGFVEGMLDGTIPYERQNTYLKIVSDEAKRLTNLVNDILLLAKTESTEKPLEITTFDLSELLRTSVIKFEKRIKEKGISLYIMFDDKTMVSADKNLIMQVVTNIIDNAVKFSENGGKIELAVKDNNDGKVIVSVSNSGQHISEADQKMIWDRFYKTDKSRNTDKTGTGLGLFIVKNIISKHSQKIWVESEPNKMTTFSFTLNKA